MHKKLLLALAAGASGLLLCASSAKADAILTLIAGTASTSVSVGPVPVGQTLILSGTLDGWSAQTQVDDSSGGSAGSPDIAVTSNDTGGAGASTLYVFFSESGYTYNGGVELSLAQAATTATVSFSAYDGNGNTPFTTTAAGGGGPSSLPSGPVGGTLNLSGTGIKEGPGSITVASPYALTTELVVSPVSQNTKVAVGADLAAVPDGGMTLALLGGVVVSLSVLRSRSRRKA